LALVEEEDGIVGLVDAAEGFVRVVCPNAEPEINERAAVAAKIARMFTRFIETNLGSPVLPTREDPIPTMLQSLSFDNQVRQFLEPSLSGWIGASEFCGRPRRGVSGRSETDFADPKTAEEASGPSLSSRIPNFGRS
jgi:hypothetical protein